MCLLKLLKSVQHHESLRLAIGFLLHNDDYNSMEHVVQVLTKTVPSLTQPQAVNIMMEAHTNGLALVISCAQEHAEFYSETLKANGLESTIEPDE